MRCDHWGLVPSLCAHQLICRRYHDKTYVSAVSDLSSLNIFIFSGKSPFFIRDDQTGMARVVLRGLAWVERSGAGENQAFPTHRSWPLSSIHSLQLEGWASGPGHRKICCSHGQFGWNFELKRLVIWLGTQLLISRTDKLCLLSDKESSSTKAQKDRHGSMTQRQWLSGSSVQSCTYWERQHFKGSWEITQIKFILAKI